MINQISEAMQMFARRNKPFREYSGTPEEICTQIIADCFNGKYFQTSTGHFAAYYSRDFGMCVLHLCELGYREQCIKTLKYALEHFVSQGHVTVLITKQGKCIDVFSYGPDSLAFLLKSLHVINDKDLVARYKSFLEKEITHCFRKCFRRARQSKQGIFAVVDEWLCELKPRYFSSARDHYHRPRSCYDVCMLGMIIEYAKNLGLTYTVSFDAVGELQKYWFVRYYQQEMTKDLDVAADAQIFPFYCQLAAADKFAHVFKKIRTEKLDQPFPIKYEIERKPRKELFIPARLAPNYEGDAIWPHIGLCWVEVVGKYENDSALVREYLQTYFDLISLHKTFLEVYDKDGKPYQSSFYRCDEGMLWCSMWLNMWKKVREKNVKE